MGNYILRLAYVAIYMTGYIFFLAAFIILVKQYNSLLKETAMLKILIGCILGGISFMVFVNNSLGRTWEYYQRGYWKKLYLQNAAVAGKPNKIKFLPLILITALVTSFISLYILFYAAYIYFMTEKFDLAITGFFFLNLGFSFLVSYYVYFTLRSLHFYRKYDVSYYD